LFRAELPLLVYAPDFCCKVTAKINLDYRLVWRCIRMAAKPVVEAGSRCQETQDFDAALVLRNQ
jgi:hypothetical protein